MSRAGEKIIAGLNDAIAFMRGEKSRSRILRRGDNGKMYDATDEWMHEQAVVETRRAHDRHGMKAARLVAGLPEDDD